MPHQPTTTTTKPETTTTKIATTTTTKTMITTIAKCQLQGREGHVGKTEFPEAHGHPRGIAPPGEGKVRTLHADPGAALSGQMCRVQRSGLGWLFRSAGNFIEGYIHIQSEYENEDENECGYQYWYHHGSWPFVPLQQSKPILVHSPVELAFE